MRAALLVVLSAACAACAVAPATALGGTLDQQQTSTGSGLLISSSASFAQTFRAGLTGGLDQVDLFLNTVGGTPPSYLSVDMRDVSGGLPGDMILASRPIPGSAVSAAGSFVPVHFSPPAAVLAGTEYAIVVYTAQPGGAPPNYGWAHSLASNPYAEGGPFSNPNTPPHSGAWASIPGTFDMTFRTYVVPSPPPAGQPSTPTGERAAALANCKKRGRKHDWPHKRLNKCRKSANLLPA